MSLRERTHQQERIIHQVHQKSLRQGHRTRLGVKQPRYHVFLTLPSHELVPKFHRFTYKLEKYSQLSEAIVYSEAEQLNGI